MLTEASLTAAQVLGAVTVDVKVEVAGSAFVANGYLKGEWSGECRRCLQEVRGDLQTPLREVFEENPSEGETWPTNDWRIDLAPAVREVAILSLPLAPLCSEDCAGPEPDRFPTGPTSAKGAEDALDSGEEPIDPRWAALSELRFND